MEGVKSRDVDKLKSWRFFSHATFFRHHICSGLFHTHLYGYVPHVHHQRKREYSRKVGRQNRFHELHIAYTHPRVRTYVHTFSRDAYERTFSRTYSIDSCGRVGTWTVGRA